MCRRLTIRAAVALGLAPGTVWAQSITNLGELFGGSPSNRASRVLAVSADGSAVAGLTETSQGNRGFRWTTTDGMQSMEMWPRAISGDGAVVVGSVEDLFVGTRAALWTAGRGVVPIAGYDGLSYARGVNQDGSVIVGTWNVPTRTYAHAFRWTPGSGMADLGALSFNERSEAVGVSQDGNVVAGTSDSRAFRWTAATGLEDLGWPDWPGMLYDSVSLRGASGNLVLSDDFDAYLPGVFPCVGAACTGPGGWSVWHTGGQAGKIVSGNAHSGNRALRVSPGADVVHTGFQDSGSWTLTAQVYFPAMVDRPGYFIVLAAYNGVPAGVADSWAIVIRMDPLFNQVFDEINGHYPYGPPVPVATLIRDQWVEIRAEINLDLNVYDFYYADQRVIAGRTYSPAGAPAGSPAIVCVDLFGGYPWIGAVELDANAISGNGTTIVGGQSNVRNTGYEAFRCIGVTRAQNLGSLDFSYAFATAVNGDGSIVVGNDAYSSNSQPFIWTGPSGMVDLSAYLAAQGVDLTGWGLWEVTGISADGAVFVGNGGYDGEPRAWLVRLPGPPQICPDVNGDGHVNLNDLATQLAFFGTFSGAAFAEGDLDSDGDVDLSDLTALLANYGTTCP